MLILTGLIISVLVTVLFTILRSAGVIKCSWWWGLILLGVVVILFIIVDRTFFVI